MNKNNLFFQIAILILIPLSATSATSPTYFEEKAPPSLADHLQLSRPPDGKTGGWLPNLTGLPSPDQVIRIQQSVESLKKDPDSRCNAIDWNLRKLIYQHFLVYQQMAMAQNIRLDKKVAQDWAHILAMILKESSGDSTSVTDMKGESISTYKPKTNLQKWEQISSLTPQSHIPLNYQTNFGLTQMSSDRLFNAFHLAKEQSYDTSFLEGRPGATSDKPILNTAIAIRRLIWLYQGAAQGRVVETELPIAQADINKPGFSEQYQKGLKLALLYCGTNFMFSEGENSNDQSAESKLQKAMASIAYCKLGNPQVGYGMNEMEEQCFAKWVTLCPALNIDIAALTPLKYFATRGEQPVCEDTFNKLIKNKLDL